MSDPIEDRLRSLATESTLMPPPPSDIRRRGDRLRRRNHALAVVGGALVVGLAAGSILNLTDVGKDPAPGPAVQPSAVADADVLTVADLPARDRLGDWEEATPNGTTLSCVPADVIGDLDSTDSADRRFGAYFVDSTSPPYGSEIRETVLEFDSDAEATAAHQSVASWLNDCDSPDLVGKARNEQHPVDVAGAVGFWELFLRSADDVCDECDAVRFDRQAAIRIDTRLVLLSLNEIGGPLEPEGLDTSMEELVVAAVTKADTGSDTGAAQSPTG